MVLNKIKNMINGSDERYETLYHKYSQSKLNNKKLKEESESNIIDLKKKVKNGVIKQLIGLYEKLEESKSYSLKVNPTDRNIQKLMMSITAMDNEMHTLFKKYGVEEYNATEKEFNEDLHDIIAYKNVEEDVDENLIVKTIKKGLKSDGKILRKPKVAVTKLGIKLSNK